MSPSQIQLSKKSNLKRFGSKDLAQKIWLKFFTLIFLEFLRFDSWFFGDFYLFFAVWTWPSLV